MATEATAKATLGQRTVHELKEFAILTAYLYVTLGAVIVMKNAVLHDAGISFTPWGIAAVKALLLAKFTLLGRAMGIGERYTTRPADLADAVQGVRFPRVVGRPDHHRRSRRRPVPSPVSGRFARRAHRPQARGDHRWHCHHTAVLIPYCAIGVLSEALGEGRLARMFFVDRGPAAG
jgi:hypothetical protein